MHCVFIELSGIHDEAYLAAQNLHTEFNPLRGVSAKQSVCKIQTRLHVGTWRDVFCLLRTVSSRGMVHVCSFALTYQATLKRRVPTPNTYAGHGWREDDAMRVETVHARCNVALLRNAYRSI